MDQCAQELMHGHIMTGLFQHFAPDRPIQAFPRFDQTARQRPVTFQWMPTAFDQ